jgi:hypothetical protein
MTLVSYRSTAIIRHYGQIWVGCPMLWKKGGLGSGPCVDGDGYAAQPPSLALAAMLRTGNDDGLRAVLRGLSYLNSIFRIS